MAMSEAGGARGNLYRVAEESGSDRRSRQGSSIGANIYFLRTEF